MTNFKTTAEDAANFWANVKAEAEKNTPKAPTLGETYAARREATLKNIVPVPLFPAR